MDEIEAEWIECSINQVKLTLSQLSNSQLIQSNLYNLMDFMSAIEILDDRTDSYSTTTTTTTTTALNPLASISYPILIHLIDFIFTLEQSYWHGIPLISSLWTCHFFRSHPLLSLSSSSSPPHRILLAFLLSTIKITELQYDELCKNNVHENEDLHLATASIIFQTLLRSGFGHPTTVTNEGEERGVVIETDDVLKLVDETILLINEEDAMDNQLKQALIGRLAIRMVSFFLLSFYSFMLVVLTGVCTGLDNDSRSPSLTTLHLSPTNLLPSLSRNCFPSDAFPVLLPFLQSHALPTRFNRTFTTTFTATHSNDPANLLSSFFITAKHLDERNFSLYSSVGTHLTEPSSRKRITVRLSGTKLIRV